jgi:ankyrin repeat protein
MMEIAKLLLASGADGGEALQRAVGRCDIVGVKWLLAVGVDIDARDEEGNTALIWATRRKDQIMVRHLLDARANAAIRNQWGSMALSFARGVDVQLAAMLTEALALRNGTVLGRL